MQWRLRHAGSPNPIPTPLSVEQIVEGLKDGFYDHSDEVKGLSDKNWVAVEKHPMFEDAVDTIDQINEILDMPEPEDESIDMNPLIDVCLVLLVFFILATTLSILDKVFDVPKTPKKEVKPPAPVDIEIIKREMIVVEAEKKDGKTVVKVDGRETRPEDFEKEFNRIKREIATKKRVFIDSKIGVEWDVIAKVIDAARGVKLEKVVFKNPNKAKPGAPGGTAPAK